MKRNFKKIVYGIFYLIVVGFVVWWAYGTFGPEPNCFDGIQNQGEEGIDCGGVCAPCELTLQESIHIMDKPQTFQLESGNTSLLVKIFNPNETHNAEFSYRFIVYNDVGSVADTITGFGNIYVLEKQYIQISQRFPLVKISQAEFEITDVVWQKADNLLKSEVIVKETTTVVEDTMVVVSGIIRNESAIFVSSVKVIALLFDTAGYIVFANQTVERDITAFVERSFEVQIPADEKFVEKVDIDATQVILVIE